MAFFSLRVSKTGLKKIGHISLSLKKKTDSKKKQQKHGNSFVKKIRKKLNLNDLF